MCVNIKCVSFARHCFAINMCLIFCNLIWTSHHLIGMNKTNTNLDPQTTANTITLTSPIKSHSFRPLLVTITTNGFVNLTKNWIISLQKHNITDSLILCGDIECYESLINFSSTINVQLISQNEILSQKRFAKFGSEVYKKMVNERSGIMHSLFMDLYNNSIYDGILFMDSDIAITNNFIPLIENKYLYHNKTEQSINDLIVVKDVADFECNKTSDGPYCGCMLLLPFHKRDNDIKIHKMKMDFFFGKWWNTTHRPSGDGDRNGDQQPMNRAIRKLRRPFRKMGYPLKLGVLNCTEFPSGWSMQNDLWVNMYWNNPLNRTVQVVHANFVTGYDSKVALLDKYNLWYI
eukprot:120030_1